jgi:hypothetical protein
VVSDWISRMSSALIPMIRGRWSLATGCVVLLSAVTSSSQVSTRADASFAIASTNRLTTYWTTKTIPPVRKVAYRSHMLRKVADGVYWIEDADGLPSALVTTLDNGTPLKVAEQWWTASRTMMDPATDLGRELLERYGKPGEPSGT